MEEEDSDPRPPQAKQSYSFVTLLYKNTNRKYLDGSMSSYVKLLLVLMAYSNIYIATLKYQRIQKKGIIR